MPRIRYEAWKPGADARALVATANDICADYQQQGYDLTLRQLYYQFVARGIIPNSDRSYSKLGSVVNKARMAGLMDWHYIVDRTRNLAQNPAWSNVHPSEVLKDAADGFSLDLWQGQPTRVEVWVEKEALAGVVGRSAVRADCAYFSCRGYVSQSEQWRAGRRLGGYIADGQNVVILHLGDHDPSGIDMTRDIRERLETFISQDYLNDHGGDMRDAGYEDPDKPGVFSHADIWEHMSEFNLGGREPFRVERIALNMDQVEEYNPPPNPAKLTDSRSGEYVARYGDESWELDALDPATLDDLITAEIEPYIDHDIMDERLAEQQRHRDLLRTVSTRWDDVVEQFGE